MSVGPGEWILLGKIGHNMLVEESRPAPKPEDLENFQLGHVYGVCLTLFSLCAFLWSRVCV